MIICCSDQNCIFVYILHKCFKSNWKCNILFTLINCLKKLLSLLSHLVMFESKSAFKNLHILIWYQPYPNYTSFSAVKQTDIISSKKKFTASFVEKIMFNALMVLFEIMPIAFLLGLLLEHDACKWNTFIYLLVKYI